MAEEQACARSVVRQALQALARDGWILPAYPRGYVVLGARIPWLSRVRPLSSEPWAVRITQVREYQATAPIADALGIAVHAPTIERASELRGAESGEVWGLGLVTYPAGGLDEAARAILLDRGELTYDHLEAAFRRRIVGYRERIQARAATRSEQTALDLSAGTPVIEVARITRTTTSPISAFTFRGRADRFEADYLVEA